MSVNSQSNMPTHAADEAIELLEQGRAHLKAGRHREALAISDRLLKQFEETPEALLFAGEVHFTRANFVESERLAKQCSDQFPGGPSGRGTRPRRDRVR